MSWVHVVLVPVGYHNDAEPPHCYFCICKQRGNTEFCVCIKTQSCTLFLFVWDIWFAFCGAIILHECTNDLICLTNLFCRDLLYKPVVLCKSLFFMFTENSLTMSYSSKLIYHLLVQHVVICHVSGVSTKLCKVSRNPIALCVGSPIYTSQVSVISCIICF